MEEKQIKNEEEIAHRIVGMWLKIQFIMLGANGVVFFILGYTGLLEKRFVFVFWGLFTFFMFLNGERILRTCLSKQERQVLNKLSPL